MVQKSVWLTTVTIGLLVVFSLSKCDKNKKVVELARVNSISDVKKLFPKDASTIIPRVEKYIAEEQANLDALIAVPAEKRNFENTARALDNLHKSNLMVFYNAIWVLKEVSPEKEIRQEAQKGLLKVRSFFVDVANNKNLYLAFKSYVDGNAKEEQLSDEQRYYLQETIEGFEKSGLNLPDDKLAKVKKIKKEISEISTIFATNIAKDKSKILVNKAGLAGLQEDFISSLSKEGDKYILRTDYPTCSAVMNNCSVEQTRKDFSRAFGNRAYPENEKILQKLIAKRDELAKLLGYKSFAHLNIDSEMAETPERAKAFLENVFKKAQVKEAKEMELLLNNLPKGVELTKNGKFKSWDFSYVKNQYKKKHLALDEEKIAEYFPMASTIDELLDIYEQFMGLTFKKVDADGFWHKDVQLLEVSKKGQNFALGYFILDLYPRENKFSHAAHFDVIPSLQDESMPTVSFVVANFPKPTNNKPSLLKRSDVNTFFHEFGHALHSLFGQTQMASFSGTATKRDFVEMPSQMLEEWLWDFDILKKVSNHYKTGNSLPDDMIDKILSAKNFDTGWQATRQCSFGFYAFDCFAEGHDKDPQKLQIASRKKYSLDTFIEADPENHFYTAFGHLTGYGARYYGYMWSKVFALDMFAKIKKHGLLNPKIGQEYVNKVLAKGGSKDPNELIKDFLEREPNDKAFFADLGLS